MGVKPGLSHKFLVFGNRVLRRIFGPKREEASGAKLEKTA
jgi:hypothetical protein